MPALAAWRVLFALLRGRNCAALVHVTLLPGRTDDVTCMCVRSDGLRETALFPCRFYPLVQGCTTTKKLHGLGNAQREMSESCFRRLIYSDCKYLIYHYIDAPWRGHRHLKHIEQHKA